MKTLGKIGSYIATSLVIVLVVVAYLQHSYYATLNDLFEQVSPSKNDSTFNFFSGDRNVTNDDNYPHSIDLNLKPGDTFSGVFVAQNNDDKTRKFTISSSNIRAVDKFEKGNLTEQLEKSGGVEKVLPSLTFQHKTEFAINKRGIEIIEYTLKLPTNIKEGKYMMGPALKLERSTKSKQSGASIDLYTAVGIVMNLEVSNDPVYYKYEPLISKEPYEAAKNITITKLRFILATILGLISLFFILKHFKIKLI